MEMKLDMIKTIKRLSGQGQNDILKNKLREWLQTKAFTLSELLSHCREGTFQLSGGLLNKLGSMYSSGADGLAEDCNAAYTFFEMAAELGHAGGHANCAQYYFDGLAPGGKNNELALVFCSKAIELGLDKHMLMAEILFDMQQYAQAVTWLHKILQTKGSADKRRRTAARQLERQCLFKQLNRVFYTLHTSGTSTDMASSTHATDGATNNTAGRASTPTRGMHALAINTTTVSPTTTPIQTNSIFFSANTPRSQFLSERLNTNIAPTNANSSLAVLNINLPTELAGWVSISDQLEGFDRNACAGLTTQAEWLELEVQSARAGFESAQAHIASLRRDHLAEEIIALLETTKVAEFKNRYENMVKSKDVHLACWEEYINTQEHILRRQVNTEQAFFSAKNTNNKLTQFVATELLKLRTVDETAGEGPGEPFILNLIRSGGAPNSTSSAARIPTARCLITAERALLELATSLYPVQTYHSRQSIGNTDTNTESSRGMCGNNISVLRNTGWTAVEKARAAALAVASDPATTAAATFTNNSSTIGFVSTPTHSNTHNSNNNITPVTPRRSSTPLKSPLHSASMSNLRISMESPMKPSSDGYISPTPRSARGGVTSPTASSARQSVVPSVVQKTSQSKPKTVADADTLMPMEPPALFTPAERIVVDNTPISYRCCTTVYAIPNDYNVHHSGFISDAPMSSDEVLTFFNHLTMVGDDPVYAENERILSQIIQRFLHDGVPVQLMDLQCMNSDLNESDKGMLNKVVFHYFIRRVVRWLVPIPEESNSNMHPHKLAVPLASIYARALQLIEQGILTFSEAFDKDGMYGVFYSDEQSTTANASTVFTNDPTTAGVQHSTHSRHVPPLLALRNKCKHINALYQKYIVELAPRNFLPTIHFWKQHAGGATVPTYKLLYSELMQVYGGESDDTVDLETMCCTTNSEDTVLQVLLQKLQS